MSKPTYVFFSPYSLGDLELKNRVVMAPPTRTRADNAGKVPTELMAEYMLSAPGPGSSKTPRWRILRHEDRAPIEWNNRCFCSRNS